MILVVDGDLKINGDVQIYGFVYVTQDWNNGGMGNASINGAIAVDGDFSASGNGSVTYDSPLLQILSGYGSFAKLPGSWRDN